MPQRPGGFGPGADLTRAAGVLRAEKPGSQDEVGQNTAMRDAPKFSEELKKMEYEPLSPVEKKLIAGSLLLGAVLLGLLIWISNKFFPG